jgi:siderophore synthetase component
VTYELVADEVTAHTLLNCLLREVSGPQRQARTEDGHTTVHLPHGDVTLRARVRRAALTGAHRFTGGVEVLGPDGWLPIGWHRLAEEIGRELELAQGARNEEFVGQVRASRDLIHATLAIRPPQIEPQDPIEAYLASEQALVFGHRYHPTPKARSGAAADALAYAPEACARFPLHHLAVRRAVLREDCADPAALAALDTAAAPPGYAALPVHPWQWALLREDPGLRHALRRGDLLDLGPGGPPVVPTASVRTVYDPASGAFLKLSLSVRITNCVRRNADYELTGAVALTRLLRPLAADLAARFPGTVLLPEPAYRTVGLPGLVETLGVIVRDGLARHLAPGVTPLLAGALADEHGPLLPALLRRAEAAGAGPLDWWDAYVARVLPPVLHAYFGHGVVTEPHLQNVVVGVGPDGLPRQVFLRDLEGTKLLPGRYDGALPPRVAEQVGYDPHRGWNRVVYCLLVNHLSEVLATLADAHPSLEAACWARLREHLIGYRREYGDSPQLRGLLCGVPLPGKANLLTRWARQADRHAGYVPLANPVGPLAVQPTPVAAR